MEITNKREQGDEGEQIAAEYLASIGYEIIERNYRYGKTGEIDIIARDPESDFTVFIEVKMRKNLEFGEPEYAITKKKAAQLKKMAYTYLYDKEIYEVECRFDVVAILKIHGKPIEINHYMNAFD